jgi:hypothetical protein
MTQSSGFGKFVPGFEFLQNLAGQAATGVTQGISQNLPQIPNLSNWVAPTFNVEELEKRIEELKAVHFWLDQNAKALGATIQALEVQKMTLATLKTMNFSLGDVANALKIKAADTAAGLGVTLTPEGKPKFAGLEVPERTYGQPPATPVKAVRKKAPVRKTAASRGKSGAGASAAPAGVVDPMQWWGAVSQQFQQIATNAMKDVAKQGVLDATQHMASELTGQAVKTAAGMAGKAADTVGRNMGVAAGVGKAAARAVTGQGTPRKSPVASRKAATPVKARKRSAE